MRSARWSRRRRSATGGRCRRRGRAAGARSGRLGVRRSDAVRPWTVRAARTPTAPAGAAVGFVGAAAPGVRHLHRVRGARGRGHRGPALGARAGAVRGGHGAAHRRRRAGAAPAAAAHAGADRRGARRGRVARRGARRIGFEVEPFGGRTVVVHAVPAPHPALRCRRVLPRDGGRPGAGPVRRLGQPAGALRRDLRLPRRGQGGRSA